jgi:hypothetical protein
MRHYSPLLLLAATLATATLAAGCESWADNRNAGTDNDSADVSDNDSRNQSSPHTNPQDQPSAASEGVGSPDTSNK